MPHASVNRRPDRPRLPRALRETRPVTINDILCSLLFAARQAARMYA